MRPLLICLALLLSLPAFAQTVYKWTDANGTVHYGDRPPDEAQAQSVDIAPLPSESIGPQPTKSEPKENNEQAPARPPLTIVMYARETCVFCIRARQYFAQRGLNYLEKDVDHDARAEAEWKRLGGTGVPLFVINGNVARGFNAGTMTKRLAAYGW